MPGRRGYARHPIPHGFEREIGRCARDALLTRRRADFESNRKDLLWIDDKLRRTEQCAIDQAGHGQIHGNGERSRVNSRQGNCRSRAKASESRNDVGHQTLDHGSATVLPRKAWISH
jgi:hypothetical protein